jgi:hypothetical protein
VATFVLREGALAPEAREEARWAKKGPSGWLPVDFDSVAEVDVYAAPTESRLVSLVLAGPAILVTCAALVFAVLTRPIAALRVAWGATHDSAPRADPLRIAR